MHLLMPPRAAPKLLAALKPGAVMNSLGIKAKQQFAWVVCLCCVLGNSIVIRSVANKQVGQPTTTRGTALELLLLT